MITVERLDAGLFGVYLVSDINPSIPARRTLRSSAR